MTVCIIFRTRTNPVVHRCKKISLRTILVWKGNEEIQHFMYTTINVQNLEDNFHYSVSRKTQSRNREKKSVIFVFLR